MFRKITTLPGTRAIINQVPGFMIAYGAVAAFFFTLRLDFSRQQFLLSFVLVTAFFFLLTLLRTRVERRVFALVKGGRSDSLTELDYVDWVVISDPSEADALPNIPLVADFKHAGLSREWERYLAEAAISGRQVFNTKQLRESLEGQVQIEHLSENTFGHLAPDSLYAPAKLYVDVLVALVRAGPAIAFPPADRACHSPDFKRPCPVQAKKDGVSRPALYCLQVPVHARANRG